MAERYGGKFSPDGRGAAPTGSPGTPRPRPPMTRATGTARVNLMYLAPLPLLFTAFGQGAVGMAVDLVAAGVLVGAAFLLSEGIKAEAAFNARTVARRPALPRKVIAAVLCGLGVVLAAFDPSRGLLQPLIYGAIAIALHLGAFGLDPLKSKGIAGQDSFQKDRVARAVDQAEAHLKAMTDAIARARDPQLQRRVETFAGTARTMFRKVEEDPRDLTAARKYLGVYLEGARDATIKFADLYARNRDARARQDYAALLDDLDSNFVERTNRLMEDDRTNLDIEIGVLRERLSRDLPPPSPPGPPIPARRLPMSESARQQAQTTLKEVEAVNAVVLAEPAPADDVPVLADSPAPVSEAIRKRMAEIDISNTGSIVHFGSAAQAELQVISQAMLADVKNKDIGPAGDSLREIVTTIRGFSVSELDPNRKQSWWERLFGRAKPLAVFMAKYENVQGQIDKITEDLERHETVLLKDIKSLDLLYDKTLNFYDELALYIAAGTAKLQDLDGQVIPAKEAEVNAAPEEQQVMEAQELRDLRAARDDLERRVHDLKLTRQVTMQSLPSIRLVQENDKSLVTKINSTLVNTVPLWETQLAQALTIQRSAEAAKAVREATDLTNDLLTANAENLRQTNRAVRQEMERGVFDIEAVKRANASLVATINESLQIADEGKARRATAEADLVKMEHELRDTLASAKARQTGLGDTAATSVPRRRT